MNSIPTNASSTLHKRFWARVSKTDGCWNFRGTDRQGYSELRVTSSSADPKEYSHRLSYMLHNGEIPAGAHVLHRCDNRRCVRPDHLFLGSNADNVADKMEKGRQRRGATAPGAKYTEDTIRRVRSLRQQGMKLREIAVLTGIEDFRYVSDIINHKTWRHVAA